MCVSVVRNCTFGYYWSCVVEQKGIRDEHVITRLAQLIQRLGLVQLAYRSDREAALTTMLEEACQLSGRKILPINESQEAKIVKGVQTEEVPEPPAGSYSCAVG